MMYKPIRYKLDEVASYPIAISHLKNTAKYIGFMDYISLYYWYKHTSMIDRHYHEILRDNPHKFFLDIDQCENLSIICSQLRYIFPDVILTIFRTNVSSYHIITNMQSPSLKHSKYIAYVLHQSFPSIDLAVYSHNKSLRMEGSRKLYKTKYNVEYSRGISPIHVFLQGLIMNIDNSIPITVNIPSTFTYDTCDTRYDIYNTTYDISCFRERKRDDKLIYLDRISSSYCTICCRVHDRENAAITYSGKFICWRNNI